MKAYQEMMKALPDIFECFGADDEFLPNGVLRQMADQIRDTFFLGEMIPPYEEKDVIQILKYYAQYESAPNFYTFDAIDKSKLDVAAIAKYIWDEGLGGKKEADYLNSLWDNTDENILRLFFGRKMYFMNQYNIEKMKLQDPSMFEDEKNTKYGARDFADMNLMEIRRTDPEYEKKLRDDVFNKAKDKNGNYVCARCGLKAKSRIPFQVDHYLPLNKGGKSIPENLQILCRKCNAKKGDS